MKDKGNGFERTVAFAPAFDKRDPDPSKDYGIHGVEAPFVLKGPKGAVQFLLFTGWHLPHVQEELVGKCRAEGREEVRPHPAALPPIVSVRAGGREGTENAIRLLTALGYTVDTLHPDKPRTPVPSRRFCHLKPMPADLGYHSPVPRYEGHEPISDDCEFLGGPCYYDGSGLNAAPVLDRLLAEGDAGVWAELESYYHRTFEGGEPS